MSFWGQLLAAALISAVAALWVRLRMKAFALPISLAVPLPLGFAIYFLPVWLGAEAGSYVAWSGIGLLMTVGAGIFGSVMILLLL